MRQRLTQTVLETRGRVLAALVPALGGDLELAEDALQDALLRAVERWPDDGLPANPAGWLYTTAKRRALDRLRLERGRAGKRASIEHHLNLEAMLASDRDDAAAPDIADERLALIFTCCHPALGEPARVALTLKTLGRLDTPDIARAFLVPETTMAQRIVRAKRKIRAASIPYQVPGPTQWAGRLDSVLSVIYLIFNQGYTAGPGIAVLRDDLTDEALRLGRILCHLLPHEPEVASLLALMALHDARSPARLDDDGELVALEAQDRRLWHRHRMAEGLAVLRRVRAMPGGPGPYRLQAEISAEHVGADSFEATRWDRIAGHYDRLYALRPDPVVRINGAVAIGYALGPAAGLQALRPLEGVEQVEGYQPYQAARAELLARAGRPHAARLAYEQALALSTSAAERRFLARRMANLLGAA